MQGNVIYVMYTYFNLKIRNIYPSCYCIQNKNILYIMFSKFQVILKTRLLCFFERNKVQLYEV